MSGDQRDEQLCNCGYFGPAFGSVRNCPVHGVTASRLVPTAGEDTNIPQQCPACGSWNCSGHTACECPRLEEHEDEQCDCANLDALEVLCRVFEDGVDVAYPEWLLWYKPEQWLNPSRALGGFIWQRLKAERAASQTDSEAIELLRQRCEELEREIEEWAKDHDAVGVYLANLLNELDEWRAHCEAAVTFAEASPCDPDITVEQCNAYPGFLAAREALSSPAHTTQPEEA